jgi:hypothetical protein
MHQPVWCRHRCRAGIAQQRRGSSQPRRECHATAIVTFDLEIETPLQYANRSVPQASLAHLLIMASFTKIEESEMPSITIHPSHKIAKINNNIYGGFTE